MESRFIVATLFLLCVGLEASFAWEKEYFTAAVYEHPRWGDGTPTRPSLIIKHNLLWYGKAAKEAKLKGADMIVYPEYGIFSPGDRRALKPYLEIIPDPKMNKSNPCNESFNFTKRPILYTLSCIAQSNEIVIVANMGAYENCTGETDCNPDGRRNLNANVVFDKDGSLLARYYKEHLYFESGMDLPQAPQDPFFKTEFGKFATFICFDIIFEKMAKAGRMADVDAVAFSTFWMNSFPFYMSIQWWQAWATGNNATILSSNLQYPGWFAAGSGIYSGTSGALVSSMRADGTPKLLIARVPRQNREASHYSTIIAFTKNGTEEWKHGDGEFNATCSYERLDKVKDPLKDYRCTEEDLSNYTLAKLEGVEGSVSVCSNGMCCQLKYAAVRMDEEFYLGVYNGTRIPFQRYYWSEENCFVARCDEVEGVPCSAFTTVSNTLFKYLYLSANFSTEYVYPSVVGSQYRLMPYNEWRFVQERNGSSLEFQSGAGFPLLMATLKGRPYDRDPPFIR